MKRHFFNSLAIAVAAATFFASCDEPNEQAMVKTPAAVPVAAALSSSMTIETNDRSISTGILQFSSAPDRQANADGSVYRHELGLLTEGFTTSHDETEGLILDGSGSSIWLQVYSKSQNLEEGIYAFTGSQYHGKAFDFWYGAVDADNKNYLFTEGQLIVVRKGDNFVLTLEGKIATAGSKELKTIKGTYEGPLDNYELKN